MLVISGSRDKSIKIWNYEIGSLVHTQEVHSESVRALEVISDKKLIASCGADKLIKIWN
jgi:WD40 repeat protein